MLSQLCKAKPWSLHNKTSRQQVKSQSVSVRNQQNSLPESNIILQPTNTIDDNYTQLQHCSFCDYRVCCLVSPCYSPESKSEDTSTATDSYRPTKGITTDDLNSKNCLDTSYPEKESVSQKSSECQHMDIPSNVKKGERPDVIERNWIPNLKNANINIRIGTMNYANIKPRSLESIPECRNESSHKPAVIGSEYESSTPDGIDTFHTKTSGVSWSVLKHRHISVDSHEDCDKSDNNLLVDNSRLCDTLTDIRKDTRERKLVTRQKCNLKDKAFSLSLIKSHVKNSDKKQPDVLPDRLLYGSKKGTTIPRCINEKDSPRLTSTLSKYADNSSNDLSKKNKLSEITAVKTEESIQQWLTRISEWVDNNSWVKENYADRDSTEQSSSNTSDDDEIKYEANKTSSSADTNSFSNENQSTFKKTDSQFLNDVISNCEENSVAVNQGQKETKTEKLHCQENLPKDLTNVNDVLCKASKHSPANIPMVVMQCSRLHSHITSKPPFQQTSLPMGTLVTALYKESDWLYIQTPHGVEGFVSFSNCIPIGPVNDSSPTSKRPWEPCDFPIQINSQKNCSFERQHNFLPTKFSVGKRVGPLVNMVKMKTNFYNDRYFNNTFKPKDSIKTAKTVTDILRSSPEIKITNQ